MDEPERDVEPALHAARVAPDDPVGGVRDPDEVEQLVDAAAEHVPRHALDPALEQEVLTAGRLAVDARLLRDVADRPPHAVRLADDVVAGDERAAGIRLRQRRQDPHRRRLPRAVRPEQAEDLACAHREGDAGERPDGSVALLEPFCDDRVRGGHGGESS